MEKLVLNVVGMTCGGCAKKVEGALQNLGAEAKVDLAAKTVTVEYDKKVTSANALQQAITDKGYQIIA
ncbi:cation transporter [Paenibacillus sp. N1-5-1-14]|uniref:heavy-metal-associated domain-containing protein n=1 Tax=Paenibacillus radicibacter TaxID=2972488 RepID=UPI0021593A74|nr:heavy-metal-associated domain-containing protein [Paenibacillus radicibacter]MCR8641613.1 cation transporter [Paenibacillus radicibacter]